MQIIDERADNRRRYERRKTIADSPALWLLLAILYLCVMIRFAQG